ncbi:MAG: hypothetical protein QW251_05445 [Desulfurococcaceae archaeon]
MIDKIGLDVEFAVKDKEGRTLYVDDSIAKGYSIGHDGGVLELRPDPAKDPKELVENLRKLMEKFHKQHPSLVLSTKDTKYPLGGHLHFSFTSENWKEKEKALFKVCEYAIGDTFWLSEETRRYNEDLWNDIGYYQVHPKTFEYKKSPSAIAYHPEFLLLTLKLVKHWIEREIPQDQDLLTKLSPLTQQERSEYLRLFHVYKTNDISDKVIEFWLYNSPVPEPKLKVDLHLSKSWDEQVKEDILSALSGYNLYVFIDLLPGKEKRANIKIDGYEKIESLEVKCPVFPYVKLPAFLRKKENWLKEKDKVLPALVEYCEVFHSLMSDFDLSISKEGL